jgi:hypothetical protein
VLQVPASRSRPVPSEGARAVGPGRSAGAWRRRTRGAGRAGGRAQACSTREGRRTPDGSGAAPALKDRNDEPDRGSEWEPIKIFLEGDRGSNKMNPASNTRLLLNYSSWPRPRSHWSATGPRNQHTAYGAKTHHHTQRKLARFAACATTVRPMACAGQTGDTGRPVDRAGQAGGYSSRPTNVTGSLSDFSRLWNINTPKTQPARKKNPSQSLAKQHRTCQEPTSNNTTRRHTDQASHSRQIP